MNNENALYKKELALLLIRVREMTEANAHTESLREIATFFDLHRLIAKCTHLNALVEIEGHMPTHLSDYRYAYIYAPLMQWLEVHEPEDYQAIRACL